jgi:hypothetical protein
MSTAFFFVGYITDMGSSLYMPGRSVFLFQQRRGFSLRYRCVQAGSVAFSVPFQWQWQD